MSGRLVLRLGFAWALSKLDVQRDWSIFQWLPSCLLAAACVRAASSPEVNSKERMLLDRKSKCVGKGGAATLCKSIRLGRLAQL